MKEEVPAINPKNAALLVMDYQSGIIGRVQDADALVERARDAIQTARGHKMQIGYVRVAFEPADYDTVPPTNKSFSALTANRGMDADAPATAIDERLVPQRGDIVVRKTRVGAFSTTDLEKQLRHKNIDTLILAGISTSGVVLSTIRDAADRDYRLYVLEDGCADFNANVHNVLMQEIFPRQAYVISIADLPGLLKEE